MGWVEGNEAANIGNDLLEVRFGLRQLIQLALQQITELLVKASPLTEKPLIEGSADAIQLLEQLAIAER